MIIVIGKKDRLLIKDAQAYIQQCGSYIEKERGIGWKEIKKDCDNIAKRLLKTIGTKWTYEE